jgi:hypothetical protein
MAELPPLPKSLLEDAVGVTRVVMLLESTTWKQMNFLKQDISLPAKPSGNSEKSEVEKPTLPKGLAETGSDTFKI